MVYLSKKEGVYVLDLYLRCQELYFSNYGRVLEPRNLCGLILYGINIVRGINYKLLNGMEALKLENIC